MEGNACYSLSGYLALKPVGALSLVLPTRRYWCAFNELKQKLEFYQSERDLIQLKTPIESIPLHRAAITLSTTEERVFIIITNQKEYHLRAENHEALMIWLLGLQTKRDSCSSASKTGSIAYENETINDPDEIIQQDEDNLTPTELSQSRMFSSFAEYLPDESQSNLLMSISYHSKLRKTSSSSSPTPLHLCDTCQTILCSHCRPLNSRSNDSLPTYRTASSSHSIESADSAFCDQRLAELNETTVQSPNLHETLLTLKCELASFINRENSYQTIIKEKSDLVCKLEKQLADLIQSTNLQTKQQNLSKVFHERTRETNNELKFLHCEISKLHRIIRDDDIKQRKLLKLVRVQQVQRESLQRDYVYLLQTSLSTEDGRLFGGTKHRERLKELLNECRKRDPSLPSFQSLEGSGLYVDSYGFKHDKSNENDRLQYICVKLTQFYHSKAHTTDEQVWRTSLKLYQNSSTIPKSFKKLVRQGIPSHLRSEFWHIFISKQTQQIRKDKGTNYFQNLCHLLPNSDLNPKFEKQIALDLHRTMPNNIRFSNKDSEGIRQLRQILQVFCLHNSSIGYCQGMNFIVAVALLLLEPEDTFWLLISITENHLNNYYDAGLIGAQVDQFVLKDLIKQKAPDIHQHFENNEVEITSLTLNWFMAIFIDSVPFETLLRIWDCFLLEGSKVLFRFALAILIINRETILTRTDTISMMKHIKDSTKSLIDVESLFKIAFEELKPFCHRKDISIKQAYWTKILAEKVGKRFLSREGFAKRDYVFQEINQSSTTLDCAVVLPDNLVWIAFGSQYALHLFEVNVERGIMMDLEVTYNSRAFCMICIGQELVLVGTLCGSLLGFSIEDRQIQWATRLRNCLLCMTSLNKGDATRIYCGLSDGNLAIVEIRGQKEPEEAFCITIDKSAITAVACCQEKLWCLNSNKLHILNEKTLDILTTVDLTFESLDPTSLIYHDDNFSSDYVWILLRSTSNTLQAWHRSTCELHGSICLNHLLDKVGRTDEQIAQMDETNISDHIRITSFLVHQDQLWLGTSTGIIYVFSYKFEKKSHRRSISQRSYSITNHLLDPNRRILFANALPYRKQLRSRSESAMIEYTHRSIDEPWPCNGSQRERRRPRCSTLHNPIFEQKSNGEFDSSDTSTTLASIKTRSSSPAVISTDEWFDEHRSMIKLPVHPPIKSVQSSANLEYQLVFKAKIADAPVKCICKTGCQGQTLIITCAGKLGDDEIVCRWKRVENTNQWTNDVIVELSPDSMLPIRPHYARQQFLKDHRDRSVSLSSSTSKL